MAAKHGATTHGCQRGQQESGVSEPRVLLRWRKRHQECKQRHRLARVRSIGAHKAILSVAAVAVCVYLHISGRAHSVATVPGGELISLSQAPMSFAGGAGAPPDSEYYEVRFNGVPAAVYNYPVLRGRAGDEGPNGSNNLASFTMEKAEGGKYAPVQVEVRSKIYKQKWGTDYHLRPTKYQEMGLVTDIDAEQVARGMISFTITAPCQLSVELGDDDVLFNEVNFKLFTNLIIAANPSEEEWPKPKPSLGGGHKNLRCKSAEDGRSCLVPSTDTPCAEVLEVESGQDIYFTSASGIYYTWEDGCGAAPKVIYLKADARMFLDEGVVVHARVKSEEDFAGIYGYGVISNYHMRGTKNPKTQWGLATLMGRNSMIWGVTLAGSTYRNIAAGENGHIYWTKSFAWLTETDCVTMKKPGGRIFNNFFKNNDDCIKTFMPNTVFRDNVIWHQGVGRAILVNWGNLGINKFDIDGETKVVNTYIIHDQQGLKGLEAEADAVHTSAKMVFYSFLIGALHSPNNILGTPESPILIKNVYIEGKVGSVVSFTNGYANLDGKAPWMGSNGCTGDMNVHIKGLDLSLVTSVAAPSIVTGCDIDESHPDIENGDCLCRTDLDCPVGRRCGMNLQLEDVIEPQSSVTKLKDTFVIGTNAVVRGASDEVIFA